MVLVSTGVGVWKRGSAEAEGGTEGGREGGREGEMEGGREGGRDLTSLRVPSPLTCGGRRDKWRTAPCHGQGTRMVWGEGALFPCHGQGTTAV